MCKIATAGSKEARQLEKVKKVFADVYRESGKAEKNTAPKSGVKYSLNIKHTDGSIEILSDARKLTNQQAINYLKQAKSGELRRESYIPVRKDTPQVIIDTLKNSGEYIKNLSLIMQVRKAQQAMSKKNNGSKIKGQGNNIRGHALSAEEIVEIISNLDNPTTIILQTNRYNQYGEELPDNIVIFVEYSNNGKEGVAVIEFESSIDPQFIGNEYGETEYHTVVTVFEPDTERHGMSFDYAEELLSNPDNYEVEIVRRQPERSATREKHPNTSNELSSNDSILKNEPSVNTKSMRESEKNSYNYQQSGGVMQKNTAENSGVRYSLSENNSINTNSDYQVYDEPISVEDIKVLRSIKRKSINQFTSEDLHKAQKWAYKFYQQLGVKSPFFRAWFGDWRAYDIKNKIKVINNSTAKEFKAGKAKNIDTGRNISWGDQIKGETKIKYGTTSDVFTFLKNIEEIVKNSILLDTNVSVLSSKHKMNNTAFMHSLYSIIEDGDGNLCLIKLLVEEAFNDKMTTDFSRAYELQEIKKVATLYAGVHSKNGGLTRQVTTDYSISDLFELVKKYDNKFNPNPVNETLLNEDGTPKVFYRGTDAEFTEFDTDNQRTSGKLNFGKGIYLTPNKSLAEMYTTTGNVMSLYAAVKNPYEIFSTRLDEFDLQKLSTEFGEEAEPTPAGESLQSSSLAAPISSASIDTISEKTTNVNVAAENIATALFPYAQPRFKLGFSWILLLNFCLQMQVSPNIYHFWAGCQPIF